METSRHLLAPGIVEPLAAVAAVSVETDTPARLPEVVKPLTPDLRRLNATVSAEFIAELEQVRAALSHKFPDGNFEQVVREAFKLVLERDKKRKALTDRPRAQSETPGANDRYVPKGHNLMKAEQHLGRALMAKFRKDGPAERDTS